MLRPKRTRDCRDHPQPRPLKAANDRKPRLRDLLCQTAARVSATVRDETLSLQSNARKPVQFEPGCAPRVSAESATRRCSTRTSPPGCGRSLPATRSAQPGQGRRPTDATRFPSKPGAVGSGALDDGEQTALPQRQTRGHPKHTAPTKQPREDVSARRSRAKRRSCMAIRLAACHCSP